MDDIDHAYCELDSLRTGLYRIRDRFGSIFKVFYKAPVSGSAYPNDAYIYLYDIASPSPDTWMAIPSKADMISYLGISGISDSHIIYTALSSSKYDVVKYFTEVSQYDVAGKSALADEKGIYQGSDWAYDPSISALFIPEGLNGLFVYNSARTDPTASGDKIIDIVYEGEWKELGTIVINSSPYHFFNEAMYKNANIHCSDATHQVRLGAII